MTVRNRFVVSAMGVGLGDGGGVWGDRIRAYHEEQARGGAGLIVAGATGVAWPVGTAYDNQVAVSEDRHVEGLAKVVEAVHAQGAKFAVQLHHGGPGAYIDPAEGRPLWVPSVLEIRRIPNILLPEEAKVSPLARITKVDFRVMTHEDIALVIRQFAVGARRAAQAGVDGLEIHAGHGYIVAAFLSQRFNRRTDDYGGSLENRARLLVEVIGAVRKEVGPSFPLWCKLDSREVGAKLGITLDDAIAAAKIARAAGVNAITVSANYGPDDPRGPESGHTPQVRGINLPAAAAIRAAVGLPVITAGRVEVDAAEAAIAAGDLDFVSMGRKLLADPALPSKTIEGRTDEVRPCIYCYTCISNIVLGSSARCAVNPRTAFEREPEPCFPGRRRIVVVGGGPAGMEAARRLDQAGQDVVLIEHEQRLGGTLQFAALAYEENEALLEWLRRSISRSAVEVRLRTEATPDLVAELKPNIVLVATGARRTKPPIPGAQLEHVFGGDDLRALMLGQGSDDAKQKIGWATRALAKIGALSGASANLDFVRQATKQWMPFGKRVVIIGAELVGLELAEFLSERGRNVTVVDDDGQLGAGLPFLRRSQVLVHLAEHGTEIETGARDIRIEPDFVEFTDSQGADRRLPADHVIVAKGAAGDLSLAASLRAAGFDVVTAGDCGGVGYIEGAMRGAANAVREIAELIGATQNVQPVIQEGAQL
jgi:2,4-dienoyl-CoA reductase-like NADH-dependent reductase (Old Yellow Enzyme family)/thioredoxin reductase